MSHLNETDYQQWLAELAAEDEEHEARHEYEVRVIDAECRAHFCLDFATGTAKDLESR